MPPEEIANAQPRSALRLMMMGTGPFAVPTFASLLKSPHRVLALVTRPDRPAHRRGKTPANPMREAAQKENLEVFEPETINSAQAQTWLRDRAADLFVVCDYGQILSKETLALARLGGINLHASILPKYRGAAPINWAIYHGEKETGVTVIHMTPKLDAGPAIVQQYTEIGPSETAPKLEVRLAELGRSAVLEAIEMLARDKVAQSVVQNETLATKAPRLKKEDGLVDWSRSPVAIFNQVRALQPWPKTYSFWKPLQSEPVRLILERVQPVNQFAEVSNELGGHSPGVIALAQGNDFVVYCGQGSLRIEAIQPAGKRVMLAGEFLRGHCVRAGDRLG
jgi:methionyl-tRNA formyltransferase